MIWTWRQFWLLQSKNFPVSLKSSGYDTYRIIDYWQQNLIVFKDWLESMAFVHKDLLAQTNPSFHSCGQSKTSAFASSVDDSTKPKNSQCPFKDGQHAIWSREKFKSTKLYGWSMCRSSDCVSIAWDMVIGQKICKNRTLNVPNCGRRLKNFLNFCTVNIKEGGYSRCLRCYGSSINKHRTRRTPCCAHQTGQWKPEPEHAGNVWYKILNFIRGQVSRIHTVSARPKSVFVSSRSPRITRRQDGISCCSTLKVPTIDNISILCSF